MPESTYALAATANAAQNCEGPNPIPATPFGVDSSGNPISCPAGDTEGFGSGTSPADGDDNFCFPASEAPRIHISGCTDTNAGFDGLTYQPVWPDGNTALHPQPILFSSPLTGRGYNIQYSRTAFEADLPRVENGCNRSTRRGSHPDPGHGQGNASRVLPVLQRLPERRAERTR